MRAPPTSSLSDSRCVAVSDGIMLYAADVAHDEPRVQLGVGAPEIYLVVAVEFCELAADTARWPRATGNAAPSAASCAISPSAYAPAAEGSSGCTGRSSITEQRLYTPPQGNATGTPDIRIESSRAASMPFQACSPLTSWPLSSRSSLGLSRELSPVASLPC